MVWYPHVALLLAQVADQANEAAEAVAPAGQNLNDSLSPMVKLLLAVVIIVGSFLLGRAIARGLRMPDYSGKIGFVLCTLFASVAVCILGWPPKLGIDLSGGVVLVYEIDRDKQAQDNLVNTTRLINERLKTDDLSQFAAQPAGRRIEIVTKSKQDIGAWNRALRELEANSALKLRPAGEREEGKEKFIAYDVVSQPTVVDMNKLIGAISRRINPSGVKEVTVRQYGAEQIEIIIPEIEKAEVDRVKSIISKLGSLEFRILANRTDHPDVIALANRSPDNAVYEAGVLVARWSPIDPSYEGEPPIARIGPDGQRQALMVIDPQNVRGEDLIRATAGNDPQNGRPCVNFSFNSSGAARFGQLTGLNLPDTSSGFKRQLGILLDEKLFSAPTINSTINDNGQITGSFTKEEVDRLVNVLNAGSLPTALQQQPISESQISAQLGADTVRSGGQAMIVATLAVLAFMLVYYRFSGLVADIDVILNLAIVLALMILMKAAFTLPGLAGLVLTVGMAVDANVLIYERMREERARGASMRMTIRNGFERATATIIDSNLTTLITGVVLWVIGTDQIKGFAITLILGLLVSMYTAIYVSRIMFDIAEKKHVLKDLKMMQIIKVLQFDYVKWVGPAVALSCVIIAIGMVGVVMRGADLLDIDFTGGSSVQMLLKDNKPLTVEKVRGTLDDRDDDLPDLTVSSVGTRDIEYKIDTSNKDIDLVKKELHKAFGDALQTYSMTFDKMEKFEPAAPSSEPPAESPLRLPGSKRGAAPAKKPAKPVGEKPAAEKPAVKPSEKPADEPAKKTADPGASSGEKPAPEKPADKPGAEQPAEPAAAGKPAAEKASETPKPDAAKPPSTEGVQRQLEASRQLASTGPEATALAVMLLAQPDAKSDAEKKPEAPKQPADEKSTKDETEKLSAEKPATAEKAPVNEEKKPEPPASAESATPAGPPTPASSTSTPATAGAAPSGEPAAAEDAQVGTSVHLHFPQRIGYDALREEIGASFKELKMPPAKFDIKNPQHKPDSSLALADWTLEIMLPPEQTTQLLKHIQSELESTPVFTSANSIGGKVAGDTKLMALYALLASLVMIVLYVWIRFQNVLFGLAAVLALIHDVLITVGFLALSSYMSQYLGMEALLVDPFKISLAVVAALLTIVGFSINDTIVIFDRIREVRGKSPDLTPKMINDSVNQTLSRTILTSGTVFIATVILYFFGGQGIHAFAFAMLVGVITGTYSSVYIAAPILLWMKSKTSTTPGRPTRPARV